MTSKTNNPIEESEVIQDKIQSDSDNDDEEEEESEELTAGQERRKEAKYSRPWKESTVSAPVLDKEVKIGKKPGPR